MKDHLKTDGNLCLNTSFAVTLIHHFPRFRKSHGIPSTNSTTKDKNEQLIETCLEDSQISIKSSPIDLCYIHSNFHITNTSVWKRDPMAEEARV